MNGLRTAACFKNGAAVANSAISRRCIGDIAITRTGKVSNRPSILEDTAANPFHSQSYGHKEEDLHLEVVESGSDLRIATLIEI
jgi:hypothetical protein